MSNIYPTGKRNQSELAWIVDPFLRGEAHREQLHNQLLLALFANTQREPPDQIGVATWVAANDKPAAATKPVSGDAAEQRLKSEIMHLPARERHRLKALQEVSSVIFVRSDTRSQKTSSKYNSSNAAPQDTSDGFALVMNEDHNALRIKLPEQQPGSAGGYSRTSKCLLQDLRRPCALHAVRICHTDLSH